ncbi:MAG: CBS domain-containing protein [Nitrososphaerota archaeon]|nr:CBS domain-containing protein [Nitrososphaerota archaeon]MDG6939141.1 CBS domain-containing protein [Nitrososphaerota archaeon]
MTSVKEIMSGKVFVMDAKKTVVEAARLMNSNDVPCILVSVDDGIAGIVTERDIVRKIVAESFQAKDVLLENIMTRPLITISPQASIEEASRAMVTYGVRRLPVITEGKLVGIVTATEIAATCAREKNYEDTRLNALAKLPDDRLPPSYG